MDNVFFYSQKISLVNVTDTFNAAYRAILFSNDGGKEWAKMEHSFPFRTKFYTTGLCNPLWKYQIVISCLDDGQYCVLIYLILPYNSYVAISTWITNGRLFAAHWRNHHPSSCMFPITQIDICHHLDTLKKGLSAVVRSHLSTKSSSRIWVRESLKDVSEY